MVEYYAPGGASGLTRVKNGSAYLANKLSKSKKKREQYKRAAKEAVFHAKRTYKLAKKVKKYGVTKKISKVARIGTKHLTREADPLFSGYTDYSGEGIGARKRQTGNRRATQTGKPKKKRRTAGSEVRDPFHFF